MGRKNPRERSRRGIAPRLLVTLAAIFALLVNNASALQHASLSVQPPVDSGHASGHHHHDHTSVLGNQDKPADPAHQLCHFCRPDAAMLPPPRLVLLDRVVLLDALAWEMADTSARPEDHFQVGRAARAPPEAV